MLGLISVPTQGMPAGNGLKSINFAENGLVEMNVMTQGLACPGLCLCLPNGCLRNVGALLKGVGGCFLGSMAAAVQRVAGSKS